MRLLAATHNYNDILLNSYEILPLTWLTSAVVITDLLFDVISQTNGWAMLLESFNIFMSPYTCWNLDFVVNDLSQHNTTLLTFIDIQAQVMLFMSTILMQHTLHLNTWHMINAPIYMTWHLATIFILGYFILLISAAITNLTTYNTMLLSRTAIAFNFIFVSWLQSSVDKLESTEEALSLIILWPWCVFIITTHLMALANYDALFVFAEWGLPVIYGLIMLLEHWWAFGVYLLVYLNGARGRKLIILTALEDIVTLSILIARVLLQAVRGLIVGMFHFICREMIWNMPAYWTHIAVPAATTAYTDENVSSIYYYQHLLFDCILTGGSFIIITAIMFLQLIFLLVSIWLFCKCWFTSWHKC